MVGWASHLYYWVYPGVMVGVDRPPGRLHRRPALAQHLQRRRAQPHLHDPLLRRLRLRRRLHRLPRRDGTTGVNAAINVIQIAALLVFSVIAIGYRMNHTEGSVGYTLDPNGNAINKVIALDAKGQPVKDPEGNFVYAKNPDGSDQMFHVSYAPEGAYNTVPDPSDATKQVSAFQYHATGTSVLAPHKFSYVIIQACIAILILVGFESVTSMGEEAKNAKRDIPRAVILSLLIQGLFCYLIEYFAANYFLHNGYQISNATASAAPVGDMMIIAGTWLFGSAAAGKAFMLVQALTVFLALIGTTLSCMSTGARVTYAMGRDEEVGSHFGLLHGTRLTPHRAIWTLAVISAVVGIVAVAFNFCGPAALADDVVKGLPQNAWYGFLVFGHDTAAKIPQSLLVVTLVSNFGTFLLYMMTNIIAIVAFREHHTFNGFKHMFIPVFGLLANLVCMLFFIVGPSFVPGMSSKEPFFALGVVALWGIYGGVYFMRASRKKGKDILLASIQSAQKVSG